MIDFPLQNNFPPKVYGYISITSEKNNLKTHVPLQKITFKENPSTLPQPEQCSSLINTSRRLKPLPAFQRKNLLVSVVFQQITFYFSFKSESLPHASLPFMRNLIKRLQFPEFTAQLDQDPSSSTCDKDLLMRITPLWKDTFEDLSPFSDRPKAVSVPCPLTRESQLMAVRRQDRTCSSLTTGENNGQQPRESGLYSQKFLKHFPIYSEKWFRANHSSENSDKNNMRWHMIHIRSFRCCFLDNKCSRQQGCTLPKCSFL